MPIANQWRPTEIKHMLSIIQDLDAISMLDLKRQKNAAIFKKVSLQLNSGKSMNQCRAKWKSLKSFYRKEVRRLNTSGDCHSPQQSILFELLFTKSLISSEFR
jgi:hypothetical protein